MGNVFETECKSFMDKGAHKLNPPLFLSQMIERMFRSPFVLYSAIKKVVAEYLTFTYLLKKKDFLKLAEDVFGLHPLEDGLKMYKQFKVVNSQGKKLVNVLEILSVIVLLSNFGQSNEKDLLHNSELIEHKINLLMILFDLRDECKVNVVEVMLLCRTVLQGFTKVYPTVKFFSNPVIMTEIQPCIMDLFTAKIEAQVKLE